MNNSGVPRREIANMCLDRTTVIANEAKQSILRREEKWIASLSLLAMTICSGLSLKIESNNKHARRPGSRPG